MDLSLPVAVLAILFVPNIGDIWDSAFWKSVILLKSGSIFGGTVNSFGVGAKSDDDTPLSLQTLKGVI